MYLQNRKTTLPALPAAVESATTSYSPYMQPLSSYDGIKKQALCLTANTACTAANVVAFIDTMLCERKLFF
jgi:hypothetical protein